MRTYTCVDCEGVFEHPQQLGVLPVRCPECKIPHKRQQDREKTERWRQRHPEQNRESRRRSLRKYYYKPETVAKREEKRIRQYGLTPEEHRALEEKQQGLCAICKGEPIGNGLRLHIDHCHNSKRVRGLLCSRCNTLLGLAKEEPAILQAAMNYLKES